MSRAAKQCREWIQATYPGVRISRKSCRDTAGGSVSQHSAYRAGEYDSNALDILGPEALPYEEERAFVNEIVEALEARRDSWSIRIILWNVPDHYGHAHVDFWPTCLEHRWCGRDITPQWRTSSGSVNRSVDPDPEHGDYNGPQHEGKPLMPRSLFEDMIRALFDIGEEFQPANGADYWIRLIDSPDNPEWLDFWAAFGRQLTKG